VADIGGGRGQQVDVRRYWNVALNAVGFSNGDLSDSGFALLMSIIQCLASS
jgi:hypothetical protein